MEKYNIILPRQLIILLALLLSTIGEGFGQTAANAIKLDVGDPAPEIKYSKWLKGEPIDKLDKDKIYVLEFWATWCGPCKANMPHLTELQQKYKDKVTIIGVGAMERVGDKPYDSSLPMVEAFVKGNSANMGYAVMADNNDQYMTNKWFKASGQNGIPAAYVVKDNKIMWMGHPAHMDTVLSQVIEGSYDIAAFKADREKRAEASRARTEARAAALKPINEAVSSKDYKTAFTLMDKLIAEQPSFKSSLDNMRFKILLDNFSVDETMAFARTWAASDKMAATTAMTEIEGRDGLPKEVYLWAANNYVSVGTFTNPFTLDPLSKCFYKGGDVRNAATYLEKAAQIGRAALNNPEMAGAISETTVVEYENRLKVYKSQIK